MPILPLVRARGFTLIELMLAVTVLAVGVLAVAASAVSVGRLIRHGDAQAASAAAAGAVVEGFRAGRCAMPAEDAGGHGLRILRSVSGSGDLQAVTVVVTYPWVPGAHTDTFGTTVACRR